MISLTIETGNSAFESDMNHEIARIIDAAADKILEGDLSPGSSISLRDFNGNNVGSLRDGDDAQFPGIDNDRFVLSFSTENDAFLGSAKHDECAEVLKDAAEMIRGGKVDFKLFDVNGNTIGFAKQEVAIEAAIPAVEDKYIVKHEVEAPVKSLYSALREAGIKVDNHASDLYVPRTTESTAILDKYPLQKSNASVFRSAIDGVMNYDIPFAFEPFWEKASLTAAQKIAMDKGEFSVADPAQDKTHSGKVLGVTDHHVVVSLGRSALIVEKRDIDRVPAVEENVTLKFEGGKGVFQPPKDLDLGR